MYMHACTQDSAESGTDSLFGILVRRVAFVGISKELLGGGRERKRGVTSIL